MRASEWRKGNTVNYWLKGKPCVLLENRERRKERQASEAQKREVEK